MKTSTSPDGREVIFERVFNAPATLVFKAFTECEKLAHWWGPKDWTLPVCNLDLRPGGVWTYCMAGPAGEQSCGIAVYREIVEPEKIVYVDRFADAEGNPNPKMPEMLCTVTFDEQAGQTTVVSRAEVQSAETLQQLLGMGMERGTIESWDRLEALLAQG